LVTSRQRGVIMNDAESDFWLALEYRICREVKGFQDRRLRSMWCDGLSPEIYDLHGDPPRIQGRAYFGPSGQEHWQFTFLIGKEADTVEAIDWPSLLPACTATGWLTPHISERTLILEPAAGAGRGR